MKNELFFSYVGQSGIPKKEVEVKRVYTNCLKKRAHQSQKSSGNDSNITGNHHRFKKEKIIEKEIF